MNRHRVFVKHGGKSVFRAASFNIPAEPQQNPAYHPAGLFGRTDTQRALVIQHQFTPNAAEKTLLIGFFKPVQISDYAEFGIKSGLLFAEKETGAHRAHCIGRKLNAVFIKQHKFGISAVVINIDSSRAARFTHGIRECRYACGIHGLGINALRRNARKHRILQYDRNRLTRCTDSRLCRQSKS